MTFNEIEILSKTRFKTIVKQACINAAFSYLLVQTSKLSKGSEIVYSKLETQSYLKPGNNLTLTDMRNIFMIRMRNLPLKCNYPSMYPDRKCLAPDCSDSDSQIHIWTCKYLETKTSICVNDVNYTDIFKNDVNKQFHVMQVMMHTTQTDNL